MSGSLDAATTTGARSAHLSQGSQMSELDDELLQASETGDLAAVTNALQQGAQVDARDSGFGRTALMTASMHSFIDVMQVLLAAGANVNLQARLGETALIMAASARGGESIRLLLANGADPTIADRDKKTVLMWLVDIQFHRGGVPFESITPLVEAGAQINAQDAAGRTALMWAVQGDLGGRVRPKVLGALVQNGADVNLVGPNGETAMFGLVRYIDDVIDLDGGRSCIQVLLDAGADPNVRNHARRTPLGTIGPNSLATPLLKGLGFTE